ncbi:MAG TPA: RNA polymerase sigma factor [Candidatus Polarisedimenticolia bacterium]|nr:RNA polymerase sigma factor [Candidatus Polarisedimenticolia bacterium]
MTARRQERDVEGEQRAVASCLAGSVEAFEPLVQANSNRVLRLAYHFLGDWDEARDLAQDTFARAYSCLRQYDPQRSFSVWLCTIAARLASDRLRRRRRTRRAVETLKVQRPMHASRTDVDVELSLREALGGLTPRQRQAVVLCDLHGFTASEAAAMIGCTGSTVRVLRLLARRRLRQILGEPASLSGALIAEPAEIPLQENAE